MNALAFLQQLHTVCHFLSTEREGKATNSELRRWLQNGAVQINGARPAWNEELSSVESIVLFPKSQKRRSTIK